MHVGVHDAPPAREDVHGEAAPLVMTPDATHGPGVADLYPDPTSTLAGRFAIGFVEGCTPQLSVVPRPSWPFVFLPQHLMVSRSDMMAHAKS